MVYEDWWETVIFVTLSVVFPTYPNDTLSMYTFGTNFMVTVAKVRIDFLVEPLILTAKLVLSSLFSLFLPLYLSF